MVNKDYLDKKYRIFFRHMHKLERIIYRNIRNEEQLKAIELTHKIMETVRLTWVHSVPEDEE